MHKKLLQIQTLDSPNPDSWFSIWHWKDLGTQVGTWQSVINYNIPKIKSKLQTWRVVIEIFVINNAIQWQCNVWQHTSFALECLDESGGKYVNWIHVLQWEGEANYYWILRWLRLAQHANVYSRLCTWSISSWMKLYWGKLSELDGPNSYLPCSSVPMCQLSGCVLVFCFD